MKHCCYENKRCCKKADHACCTGHGKGASCCCKKGSCPMPRRRRQLSPCLVYVRPLKSLTLGNHRLPTNHVTGATLRADNQTSPAAARKELLCTTKSKAPSR
jgi:hypothetical protein